MSVSKHWTARAATVLALAAALAFRAAAAPQAAGPRYPIQQRTLPNGLRVVLSPDHTAPVVALAVCYNVGSRNEVRGRTGFAHLFEHMMFQGSAHVPKGAHFRYIEGNGGDMNGFTTEETTTYMESLPAEKLPLMLWLEADRMRSLAVTAENLQNQKEVVKEEKRMRYDNQPYAAATIRLQELAYSNFANQHPTIGSMQDLDAATLQDVQGFFRTYYAPNNAVLALVGDFDPKEAGALVTRYFGGIPRQPAPPRPDLTEPRQSAARTATVQDPLARVPALFMAWHGPPLGNPDMYPLDLLADIVFGGESSRAYQRLVKGRQIALSVRGGLQSQRGPSLFQVTALYRPDVKAADMQRAIDQLLDEIKRTPPSAAEVRRVKTRLRAERYGGGFFGLETALGRAIAIAQATVLQNDPNLINTEIDRYMAVTPARIQEVARKYFAPANRTVVEAVPVRGGAASPSGGSTRP